MNNSVPILTFFNNKGGVGKTSLVFHTAHMMANMDYRVLCMDIDPQANLTSMFLDEDKLMEIWSDHPTCNLSASNKSTSNASTHHHAKLASTIYQAVKPLQGVNDLKIPEIQYINDNLSIVAGDLGLSLFEDDLSQVWSSAMGDKNLYRPFRILTAFWQLAQQVAEEMEADIILVDVGPNLGAINRSALIASDYVIVPLAADLFSLQGLQNLGPTLFDWRKSWKKRLDNWTSPEFSLPQGNMNTLGYIVMGHGIHLNRPVKAYNRWIDKIPEIYQKSILKKLDTQTYIDIKSDPNCIDLIKNYQSLVPLAQEAHKPIFELKPRDGAIGAHAHATQKAYMDFQTMTQEIIRRVGLRKY